MKTTAVICEYNPFHRGHEYQINAIKNSGSYVVCIMSGGFVQRGGPALFDKFVRAEAAVRMGADLVVELPFPYCSSAAEFFAKGGVALADSLGLIDELCFGSESGDIV
jgi:predicted nucleotidyltransferase